MHIILSFKPNIKMTSQNALGSPFDKYMFQSLIGPLFV